MILDRRLPLGKRDAEAYRRRIARRGRREPVAYITGEREFWSLPFRVTRSVLIPRPDTETLVQEGLELLEKAGFHDRAPRGGTDQGARVIDVGTGSGCVAVALAHANRRAQVLAIDRSARALRVAARNVERLDLVGRVTLCRGDLLGERDGARGAGKSGRAAPAHLILSNPPYVEDGDWEKLPPDIRDWEPAGALRGGPDGLAVHRRLRADAPAHLLPGGSIAVEVGVGQAAAVSALYEAGGDFEGIRVIADLAGIPRVVSARRR
ncbi:MAG: peptide chain release factor N(5)-glutamine methyltransferase, partial [Deltaproteobacteria bacterium]|nr:peptide chain release factor N(5)-glutamine methyltransferase [Deltaproteobacteria bacterium]